MSTVSIRPVRAEDRAVWERLWTDYLAFYETALDDEAKDIAFSRLLDPATKVHGLLAEREGTPLGLVHYIFHDHMWRPEGICYLQDLFVAPEARGTGAGRALIEAVYAAADAAGVPRVYWLTQEFNHTARRLYDRLATLSPFIRYDRPA
jgi:GNAT superfamily N-acetyltransferase